MFLLSISIIFVMQGSIIRIAISFEQVAGVVGRADLFCAFFYFAAFLSYARCFSTGKNLFSFILTNFDHHHLGANQF